MKSRLRILYLALIASSILLFLVSTLKTYGTQQLPAQVVGTLTAGDDYLPLVYRDFILEPSPTPTPTRTPPSTMPISGRITLQDGSGLAGVEIKAGLFCGPFNPDLGEPVAISDQDGYYAADIHCPYDHDETFHIFAVKSGYTFTPDIACWRTYGYCAGFSGDFVAISLEK